MTVSNIGGFGLNPSSVRKTGAPGPAVGNAGGAVNNPRTSNTGANGLGLFGGGGVLGLLNSVLGSVGGLGNALNIAANVTQQAGAPSKVSNALAQAAGQVGNAGAGSGGRPGAGGGAGLAQLLGIAANVTKQAGAPSMVSNALGQAAGQLA